MKAKVLKALLMALGVNAALFAWKYILLGLLAAVLVPFGLFAFGNYMTTYYNGLDYPWRYPDTVWRSEEPHAEIAVDGDERATLHLEVNGEMQPFTFYRMGDGIYISCRDRRRRFRDQRACL